MWPLSPPLIVCWKVARSGITPKYRAFFVGRGGWILPARAKFQYGTYHWCSECCLTHHSNQLSLATWKCSHLRRQSLMSCGAIVALLDRASDLEPEVVGSNLGSGRNCPRLRWDPWAKHRTPNCSPGATFLAAHCSKCVCTWMGLMQRTHFTASYTLYNCVCDK